MQGDGVVHWEFYPSGSDTKESSIFPLPIESELSENLRYHPISDCRLLAQGIH